ncbi:MAG: CapA family protein [Clostridia bacterium]|nr:CapA family protein [Clostridia bacterium]
MGKTTAKKGKMSKKARKAAARRRRMIRRGMIFGGIALLCIIGLIVMAHAHRTPVDDGSWYISTGDLEIAAPGRTASGLSAAVGQVSGSGDNSRYAIPMPQLPSRASVVEAEPVLTPEPTPEPTEAATPGPSPIVTPQPTAVTITITAAGDCTLGGSVNQDTYVRFKRAVKSKGYDYFFKNVRPVFEADDLTILNLEGPLTDTGKGRHGIYCFRGDPAFVQIMSGSSVELCNVANNHSLDFGKAGLLRTAQVLEQAGIGCCGYTKVYTGTIKGARVTALGFDKWQNDKAGIVQAIQQERANCDLLIVNMHWGRERHFEPMKDQVDWGHAAIDAGADLVIGTHPHVYGGVELYKGKYIAYSLGNFCFGGNGNPTDKRCMMFQQTFVVTPGSGQASDGGINIIPCLVSGISNKNNYQPIVMTAREGASLCKAIAKYSNLSKNTLWMANSYLEQIGLTPSAVATTGVRCVDVNGTQPREAVTVTEEVEALDDDALVGALDAKEDEYVGSGFTGRDDADYEGDLPADGAAYDADEEDAGESDEYEDFAEDGSDDFGSIDTDVYDASDDDADAFDDGDDEAYGASDDAGASEGHQTLSQSELITSMQVQGGGEISDDQRKAAEVEAKRQMYLDQMMAG